MGQCVTSPLCGKVLQKLAKYLLYIVSPLYHLPQGTHGQNTVCQIHSLDRLSRPSPLTTEEGNRKYQRLPSLFDPVSGLLEGRH